MTLQDVMLLSKKILVGLALTVVPGSILLGALWLTRILLTANP